MKTRSLTIAALLLGLSLPGISVARAGVMPVESGDHIKLFDLNDDVHYPQYSNGGPFRVDNLETAAANDLITFCMERDETIWYGQEYVADLSTIAQRGGVNTNDGDPLDPLTAYLFTNFYHGTNGGNTWSTADLQEVIWFIEEEFDTHLLSPGALVLKGLAETNSNGSLYDVRVMNLKDLAGNHGQSMLTVVPEPATVVLWGICGVCGLLVVRRRRRAAQANG